jgi:DNA-binding NarL/FixJ family response regulator
VLECAALMGLAENKMMNQKIGELLGWQPSTVKTRWGRIYERMQTAGILQGHPEGLRREEQRGLAIAYIRSHPEELRPYDYR